MRDRPYRNLRQIADMLTDERWEETKKMFDCKYPDLRASIRRILLNAADDIESVIIDLGGKILRNDEEDD